MGIRRECSRRTGKVGLVKIQVWGGPVEQLWRRERGPSPSEGIPKSRMHALAVCTAAGQLEYSVALALQQHGQQSALRKGRR
ncbi:MAG: hypothetical protein DME98_03635 [Verrucomicrobia bacterium]|nr:MAG: hypothetical protein DME98_03635 [Verrucomicrobiota bacterium]PYJ32011.1 MAG: hypothetical protein DME88_12345 [Verrucomicrobiota bacterium]